MVELYINNQSVVMPESFSIRLVRHNPLFENKGDYSIPFSIPLSENRHIINHADRVEVSSYQKEGAFELLINGISRYKGTVVFRDPKPEQDEISIYLKSNNSSFFSKVKNKSLYEYNFGTEDNAGISSEEIQDNWEATLDGNYANGYKYVCAPLVAPDLWSHNSTMAYYYSRDINEYDFQNEKIFRDSQNWHQHMYVMYLIDRIIRNEGYYIDRNDLDDYPDLKNQLVMISMTSQTGHWYNVEYRRNLPKRSLVEFFNALRTLYTLTPVTDKKTGRINLIMLSKVVSSSESWDDLNDKEVKHAVMKSEEPADGYIMSFESVSGDDYNYATSKANRDDAIEVSNYSNLPAPSSSNSGNLYYVTSTERYYRSIEDPDNQGNYFWKEVGNLQPMTKTNEEYKRRSNVEPILSDRYDKTAWRADPDNLITFTIESAKTGRQGNDWYDTEYQGMKFNDFPFIFAFYRGKQALDINDPYTIAEASHDKSDSDLDSIWQDSNSNEWELTQVLSASELQFIPNNHSQSMPTGTLTHVSGASQTTDINVTDTTEKAGIVNYPILSIDAYRYDNETEFSSDAVSNKWITSRGLYEKIHKQINHWETERKRKVIKYLAVPNRVFFDLNMTKKHMIGNQIFLVNKIEIDITEKDFDEKIMKAELFTV